MSKQITIKKFGSDEEGWLSFFEVGREIPFEIKRIYYIYGVPINKKRGKHAHKHLKQALWCPIGKIEITLYDGKIKKSYCLDSPEKILIIQPGIWRDIYWKKHNSVLCVAVSEYYSEEDYIRDYDEYSNYVKEGYWNDENKL